MTTSPEVARLMGLSEDSSVVPVLAHPNRLRDRFGRPVRRTDPRTVKESDEESLFPDDAEEMDSVESGNLATNLRPVRRVVQEPSHPYADKEKYLTPTAALTAPDCTPDALTPIDPGQVPGQPSAPASFTWQDVKNAAPAAPAGPEEKTAGEDSAVHAMDTILGRKRENKPANNMQQFTQAGAIKTESQAYAALNIEQPGVAEAAKAKAAEMLTPHVAADGSSAMPEPKQGNGQKICEAFRRWGH